MTWHSLKKQEPAPLPVPAVLRYYEALKDSYTSYEGTWLSRSAVMKLRKVELAKQILVRNFSPLALAELRQLESDETNKDIQLELKLFTDKMDAKLASALEPQNGSANVGD